jgi:Cu(I)/Ag(I) efflux system membrane fusion protein
MKPTALIVATVVLAAAMLAAGYWWGVKQSAPSVSRAAEGKAGAKSEPKVLYYRNPMAPADTSALPKKASDGMDFVPVYADAAPAAQTDNPKGRILFYRNPMGLPDTSPVPKKDPMGMDYVAVYEDEEPASGTPLVRLSQDKVQKLGVKTEAVALRDLKNTIRTVATVQANERLLHTVTSRFDGWIQRLYVNTTGQAVKKGEALMDVYSPDLITAQQEYLIARRGVQTISGGSAEVQASMQRLADSALQRLRNWDISETELQYLTQDGKTTQYLTLARERGGAGKTRDPGQTLHGRGGVVSGRRPVAGVAAGGGVRAGPRTGAHRTVGEHHGRCLSGKGVRRQGDVHLSHRHRREPYRQRADRTGQSAGIAQTVHVRAGRVHGFARQGKALTVPDSAVLDTGTRQLVLVQRGEGKFEPRPVKLGARGDGYIEVLEGVKAGENVVVSANFLIDAESNLKAAFSGFGQGADGAKAEANGGARQAATAMPSNESRPSAGSKPATESMPSAGSKLPTESIAIPDLADVQVIIYTEYPGQAPQVVEDQITYPLSTAMLAVPKSKVVRGLSVFGASFIYVIFEDGTDIYWARTRVLEYLNFASGRMPRGITPTLGPDATGVGWVYQYAVLAWARRSRERQR